MEILHFINDVLWGISKTLGNWVGVGLFAAAWLTLIYLIAYNIGQLVKYLNRKLRN